MALERAVAAGEDVAGINIGDGFVSVARVVRRRKGRVLLTHAGWADYAADAPEEEIVQTIKTLWKKCRIPTRTVCSGLNARSLCLKYFKYPDLTQRELHSALKLEAEESLQLPPNEIMLDWHLNNPPGDPQDIEDKSSHQGVLVAVARNRVDRHMQRLQKAGLYPVVLDVGCMALSNLYLTLRSANIGSENAVCVVNLSRFNADIAILFGERYIYPRTIFSRSAEWSGKVQYLIENISDALLYYHVKVDNTPITNLVLTGFVPEDPEFVEQIHDSVGLPTEVWNPLHEENFMIASGVSFNKKHDVLSPLMTTSLGLGLRNG